MTEKQFHAHAIDRRTFLRQVGAVGVGLGMALARSTGTATAGTSVSEAAIQELRKQLGSSKVLTPNDPDYVRTGLPANGRYRATRPAVIARCANENDVSTCVKWAAQNKVPPVVRGGGHSYAGYSTTTGLLIDIGLLNSVKVDGQTAVVGGAALNSDVYNATKDGKYFLPAGTCLGVGVGGLVLGGGIGYNSRWAGLTCDRLRSTRIVTASGEVLVASAKTNADLFWACCGGAGGSFGVNTEFTFELVEVPTTNVTYFQLEWLGADTAIKVFAAFNKLMATNEPRLNATARAQAVETTQGRSARDAIDVRSRGQFLGSKLELMQLLQSFPSPNKIGSLPDMKEISYWEAAQLFVAAPSESHSFGDISRYAQKPISTSAIEAQIQLLAECPSRSQDANGSMWSLGWVGGSVINAVKRDATAYVHRGEMSTLLRPTSAWPDNAADSVGKDLLAWTEKMIEIIKEETPNESYQNFPNTLIKDGLTQYYAENLDQLIQVKTKYDPQNVFNNAQSIPPKKG